MYKSKTKSFNIRFNPKYTLKKVKKIKLNHSDQQSLYFILEIMCGWYHKVKIKIGRTNYFFQIRNEMIMTLKRGETLLKKQIVFWKITHYNFSWR